MRDCVGECDRLGSFELECEEDLDGESVMVDDDDIVELGRNVIVMVGVWSLEKVCVNDEDLVSESLGVKDSLGTSLGVKVRVGCVAERVSEGTNVQFVYSSVRVAECVEVTVPEKVVVNDWLSDNV